MPTFNSQKHIKYSVESVLSQSYKNFELIIIDDCSQDNTVKILKKYQFNDSRIKIFKTKKNSGTVALPRNVGIKRAKGKIICFLDSDDSWEKNKLKLQTEAYTNKKYIYTTAAKYFDSNNLKSGFLINFIRVLLQKFFIKKINTEGFQWFYIYNPIIVSSVLAHKSIFKKTFFDEDINTREDLDMWIRLRKDNYKFHFVKDFSTNIFRRKDSLSSDFKKELVTLIRSLSNIFLKIKTFKKLNYFLIGILIKFMLAFIKINKKIILFSLKKISITLIILFFIIFYTPLFWYLGKPLLYYDETETFKDFKNIVLFSGHGNIEYYNNTYMLRYKDIINFSNYGNSLDNVFLFGRLQHIPEQLIIQKMLIADAFDDKKLNIIYEEFGNTKEDIASVVKILDEKNISDVIFITSPYHTKRAHLFWSKNSNINVKIFRSNYWPKKNKFFQYSKNKKIILYEYVSIVYNKLMGNL